MRALAPQMRDATQRGSETAALQSLPERAPERQKARIGLGMASSSCAKRAISSALCTFGATGSQAYSSPAALAAASMLAAVGCVGPPS